VGKAPLSLAAVPPPTGYLKLLDGKPGNKEQAMFFKSTSNRSFDLTATPTPYLIQHGKVQASTLP